MRPIWIIAAFVWTGCGRAPFVEAEPSGQQPVPGDANGDGTVDLSDGMAILHSQLSGGPHPVCYGAADAVHDNHVDLGDAFAIWYHLFAGNTVISEITPGWCDTWTPWADAPAGRLALEIDAPARATGAAQATVQLRSPDLAVEAWSLAVVAEGCTLRAATTAGTAGADQRDDPPGDRDGGFERTDLAEGLATSAVVLSWRSQRGLTPTRDPIALLALTLEPSAAGCAPCTLRLEDGHATAGEPVDNLVSVRGRTYKPALPEATVKLCAD